MKRAAAVLTALLPVAAAQDVQVSGGKTLTFAGKYLSVMFKDNGVSFNSSDRELPRLALDEVRLSCKAGVITARAGADILLEHLEDQEE